MISNQTRSPSRTVFAALVAACLGIAASPACNSNDPVATEEHELSADPGCSEWTTHSDLAIQNQASVMSPASYGTTDCSKAYRINVTDWSAGYDGTVGYGGDLPTNQTDCEATDVRAYVFRRQSESGTDFTMIFENSKITHGVWFSRSGMSGCLLPTINIPHDLPITLPNGGRDYRVAISARLNNEVVPVTFGMVPNEGRTLLDAFQDMTSLKVSIDALPSGTIHPAIQAEFTARTLPSGQLLCREMKLDRALNDFTAAALIKTGAAAASVSARTMELTAMNTALCTTAATVANLQTRIHNYLARTLEIQGQIAAALRAQAPMLAAAQSGQLASNLMAQVNIQAVGKLSSSCGLTQDTISHYVLDGTLPPGVTADKLIFGTCSSTGTPAQIATAVNFAATTTTRGQNAGVRLAQCLLGAAKTATAITDACSSPHADGAPGDAGPAANSGPADSGPEAGCVDPDTGEPCDAVAQAASDAAQVSFVIKPLYQVTLDQTLFGPAARPLILNQAAADPMDVELAQDQALVNTEYQLARWFNYGAGAASVAAGVAAGFALKGNIVAGEVAVGLTMVSGLWWMASQYFADRNVAADRERAKELNRLNSAICMSGPGGSPLSCNNQGNKFCPPDAATPGGWYEMDSGTGLARQANVSDLINHCSCEMLDGDYAAVEDGQVPGHAIATSCPRTADQIKLECVGDPRLGGSPTDAPDPACYRAISPAAEVDAWKNRKCAVSAQQQCPGQFSYGMPDGTCRCVTTDPNANPPIPNCSIQPYSGSAGFCTADSPSQCFCVKDVPSTPNGGDPNCRQNPLKVMSPLSNWMIADRDAAHLVQLPSGVEALEVRTGGVTTVTSPLIFPNSLAIFGTKLRVRAGINKFPAAGSNVDLKVYWTNHSHTELIHRFVGMCRMSGFTPGGLTSCDFPLPTQSINGQPPVNIGTLLDPINLEFEIDTPTNYTSRVMIGPISFPGGTATPAAALASVCPDPTPTQMTPLTNPLINVLAAGPHPIYQTLNNDRLPVPLTNVMTRAQ
jgi:hypothetical protein